MICNGKNIDNGSFDILDLIYVSVSDLCGNVQAAILHNKICYLLNVEFDHFDFHRNQWQSFHDFC